MKPYQRRNEGAYPYFKLATWNARDLCWRDGKVAYDTEADARAEIQAPGRFRISRVDEDQSRTDLAPFEVLPQTERTPR